MSLLFLPPPPILSAGRGRVAGEGSLEVWDHAPHCPALEMGRPGVTGASEWLTPPLSSLLFPPWHKVPRRGMALICCVPSLCGFEAPKANIQGKVAPAAGTTGAKALG